VQAVWSVTEAKVGSVSSTNLLCYARNNIATSVVWNHDQCIAIIHVTGIYYTVVSIDMVCGNASLWLTVNGKRIFEVKSAKSANDRVSPYLMVALNNGAQTRDNGAVIRLAAEDHVGVEWPEPHYTHCFEKDYSTVNSSIDLATDYIATFYGVLLSPDNS
jgi:hypothetical protein